jgi:maltose alpha-D-glucosyltransferase/alpha-amylase
VNVTAQRLDPNSLLSWFERMIRTLRECPEIGSGKCSVVQTALPRHVLAHRFDSPEGSMLMLHNLGPRGVTVTLPELPGVGADLHEVFSDRSYPPPTRELEGLKLRGYGYRWIRLSHNLVNRSAHATGRNA